MAVTKITSKQAKTQDTGTLLANRDAAQAALAANPNDKVASSNLSVINKAIGQDIGLSAGVVGQLTPTQVLSVSNARSNFSSTVNLGTVPANVQTAVTNSLNKNIKTEERRLDSTLDKVQKAEISGLLAEGASKDVIAATKAENSAEDARIKAAISAPGFQGNAFTRNDNGYITSGNTAFANDAVGQRVINAINAGYGLLDELDLTQQFKQGKTTIGQSIYKLGIASNQRDESGNFVLTPELKAGFESPRSAPQIVKYLNAISDEKANPSLSNKAKVIDVGYDDDGNRYEVISDTITPGIKGEATGFFARNAAGDVRYLGAQTSITPTGGDFWSRYGGLIVGIGAGFLLGPVANFIGSNGASFASGATFGSTVGAGAALGATGALLTGQNPFLGAITGGFGGGFASYVGSFGGLGSYLARSGLNISPNTIGLLNTIVPGLGGAAAPITDLSTGLLDDAAIASAQGAINAGAAAGLLDDATAAQINTGINQARSGILNQANPNVQTNVPGTGFFSDGRPITPGGYGLTSASPGVSEAIQDILRDVSFANADEVAEAAQIIANYSGDTITLIGPGGVPVVRSPIPLDVPISGAEGTNVPAPPPPVPTVPTPLPIVPAPVPAPTPAPIEDRSQPVVPTPNPSLLDTAGNLATIGGNYIPPLLLAASLLNREPVPTGVGNERLPAWALDPAMSAVIPRIQAAQAAMPAPMPNLFNAQFQRGGLGAGQFIGYDLLNRTGDIPQQTLLGVSPLAMPPMNLLGVTGGQAPTSQTALV